MKALVQRVSRASVTVDGEIVGRIGKGLVVLVGVRNGDSEQDAQFLANKCTNLRIFADKEGKFNLSCAESRAELLVVSQFTLYADTRKGRRPSFVDAARPEISEPLYRKFVSSLAEFGLRVETGIFGAMMSVEIHNDGPVTIMLESKGG